MSSSSASSWERVPSDYDILSSSPTDSIDGLDPIAPINSKIDPLEESPTSSPPPPNPDMFQYEDYSYLPKRDQTLFPSSLPVASIIKTSISDTSYYEITPVSNYRTMAENAPSYSMSKNPVYNPTPRRHQHPDCTDLVSRYINHNDFSRCQTVLLALCIWGAISDGVEVMCLSFVMTHIRCQMTFSAVQLSLLSSVVFIGLLLGGYVWGWLGDQWGRRTSLVISLAINGLFGLLSSFSQSFFQLIVFRFCAGIGVGGSIPLIFTYVSEISPQDRKGFFLSILATNWMLAGVGTASLAYLILPMETSIASWRIFMALCTLPAISSSILFLITPESPIWLASKSQITEAILTLKLFHPDADFKELEQYATHPAPSSYSKKHHYPLKNVLHAITDFSLFSSFSELFSPKFIRRTVVLWIVNCCTAFGFYGLSLWLPTIYTRLEAHPDEPFCQSITVSDDLNKCMPSSINNKSQYVDSMFFAFIQLPGNLLTIFGMDRVGPRLILTISLLFNAVSCLALFFAHSAWESFIISCFFSGVSVFCWNALNVVNTCYFPIEIRSTATGFFNGANRIGGLFGSLLIGVFLESGCGSAMFSLFIILLFGAFIALKLPHRSPC